MRRRMLVALLLSWLLGVGTAMAWPGLRYERQTISTGQEGRIHLAINDGWIVVRQDGVFVTLERPRLRLP